jgi:hypothetical protein
LAHQKTWRSTLRRIAHRGNTNGITAYENQLWYAQTAIDKGFDVEIDVWMVRGVLWAGHDSAQYLIREEFLTDNIDKLWIHCKNFEALDHFAKLGNSYNYFWHQDDDFTMTSQNFIWTYPGKEVGDRSVIVDLEGKTRYNCYAICSDYVAKEEQNV